MKMGQTGDGTTLGARALRTLADLRRDLVYASRSLLGSPALLVTLAGVMGTGIGAPVAVFCFVDAVLLRPLPYPDATRLVGVVREFPQGTSRLLNGRIVEALETYVDTLDHLAVSAPSSGLALQVAGGSHHVSTHRVSANYFRALNVTPIFGRHPEPADLQVDGVVVSHSLWRQHLGADPRAAGSAVVLGGRPRVVVGVMPPGFRAFPPADVWQIVEPTREAGFDYQMLGRLGPGVTRAQAEAELQSLLPGIRQVAPDSVSDDLQFGVRMYKDIVAEDVTPALAGAGLVVGLVLLVACVNVGGLQLARSRVRAREAAVQVALGCTPGRLVRQVFAESAVYAAVGGAVSLGVAYGGAEVFRRLYPAAAFWDATVDARILAFALLIVVVAGALSGLAPMREHLRSDSTGTRLGRWCQATLKTDPLATSKTDPRRNGVCRSNSGGPPRSVSAVDGRDAPSRPGRKAHNCHPSRGADGVSPARAGAKRRTCAAR